MRLIGKWVWVFGILLWSGVSGAATDLLLQHYPDARVMFKSQEKTGDYVLALASYKKIEGIWRAERYRRLSGHLQRYTLELPANHSAQAGFEFYLQQMQKFNRRELYSCAARACGASNAWANNHFKILQLYGLDQYQYYAAYEVITEAVNPYYVSLYAVQRGNKRVYVQLDILHSDKERAGTISSSPDTVIDLLQTQGFYLYPDLIIDTAGGDAQLKISDAHLQTLVVVMARQPDWRLALVGHDYHGANLSGQQQAAQSYAEQLRQALVAAGVANNRLSIHGLGSLAPAGRGDLSARVEVVLLP